MISTNKSLVDAVLNLRWVFFRLLFQRQIAPPNTPKWWYTTLLHFFWYLLCQECILVVFLRWSKWTSDCLSSHNTPSCSKRHPFAVSLTFRSIRFISSRWYSLHGTERSIARLLSNDILLFSTYSYRLGWEIVNSIRMNTENVVLALVVSFSPCRTSSSQLLGHRIRSTPSCFYYPNSLKAKSMRGIKWSGSVYGYCKARHLPTRQISVLHPAII